MARRHAFSAAVICGLLFASLQLFASKSEFNSCDAGSNHYRWQMKTRLTPTFRPMVVPEIAVHSMIDWDVPIIKTKRVDAPVDPRERELYRLVGYPRLVKESADDCDVHIQVADVANNYGLAGDVLTQSELVEEPPQVIVEIPQSEPAARAALERFIGPVTARERVLSGDDSPLLTFTGYAFLDLQHAHRAELWTKEGYGHGNQFVATLWELHPVFSVEKGSR